MSLVNLLPASEQQKRKTYLRNYYTVVAGAVLVAGTLLLAVLLLLFDQVYRLNLEAAQSAKAQAETQAATYLDVEKKADQLAKQLDILKKAQAQTTQWSQILVVLQTYTPAGVSVDSMMIKSPTGSTGANNKTEISGVADSRRSVAEFQIALAGAPYFKNVELGETSEQNGVVKYKITMDVNYDKLSGPKK